VLGSKGIQRLRPSPALLVALTALVLAMSGAAVALEGSDRVTANDIRKNAVRSQEIKGKSVKAGDIADDTITSKQVRTDALDSSDLSEYEVADDRLTRVVATQGVNAILARNSASETELYSEGDLTVYAKCFRDSSVGETIGQIFARTSSGEAMLDGLDQLPNDDGNLLHPTTPESIRRLDSEEVGTPNAADFGTALGSLAATDGTAFDTRTTIAVKQGGLAQGDGAFGPGDACLFALTVTG
jgi:hypothetical protein